MRFPAAESLDLDLPETGAIWIKTLYVSNALQSSGIGRAAMDAVEAMATEEPICARTLMLDTVCKEDQMREDFARGFYGYVPKVSSSLSLSCDVCGQGLTMGLDCERGLVWPTRVQDRGKSAWVL